LARKLLSVICLAVIGLLLADLLGIRRWTARLTIVALLALFGPVRGSLSLGQIEAAVLLPLFAAIWLRLRRPQTSQVIGLSAGLAVVALCKPQLACLPVAVVLVHGYRRDRRATMMVATAAAVALVLLARQASPSAGWSDWLTGLRDQPEGPGGSVRLALLVGGVAGIAFACRGAASCRDSLLSWLLLAASCGGLAAAIVRWNRQWLAILVLPVLALLVLGDPAAWPRRDKAILTLVAAISLPDTIGSDTFYLGVGYAVIPLSTSAVLLAAFALARLVPPTWAAATWVVAAALLLPPIEPWFAQVKGLVLTLVVLWLLPRLSTGRSHLNVADMRSRLSRRVTGTNRQGQPIG
jgi:hypothetical protein